MGGGPGSSVRSEQFIARNRYQNNWSATSAGIGEGVLDDISECVSNRPNKDLAGKGAV